MRDDHFLGELFSRVRETQADTILDSNLPNSIITDSEATRDAILCVLSLLGLDHVVTVKAEMAGPALEYHIVFDPKTALPEHCRNDGQKYRVKFMCGDGDCGEHYYEELEPALWVAVNFDNDGENCDYAAVSRRCSEDPEKWERILWCNSEHDLEYDIDDDDPDYEAVDAYIEEHW